MADEIPPVNSEPTAEDLARKRLPDPLSKGEKETFEAKIAELKEENRLLRDELIELKKPIAKAKSFFMDFAP